MPCTIEDDALEETMLGPASITADNFTHDNLHLCHQTKNSDRIMLSSKTKLWNEMSN